ncbi:MAG: hypothetical protein Fur0034_10700 [Desulfuromonadia bacterium]
MTSDKRRFRRIPFSTRCSFSCGTVSCGAEVMDISMNGVLVAISCDAPLPHRSCSVALYLDGLETPLVFDGEVIHQAGKRVGIRFVTTDVESMIHLRAILENNSLDPDRVLEELGRIIRG